MTYIFLIVYIARQIFLPFLTTVSINRGISGLLVWLPENIEMLLGRIEQVCDCPATILSTGPDREHICRL